MTPLPTESAQDGPLVLTELNAAGVCSITLNRPAVRNPLSPPMLRSLTDAVTEARRDEQTRVMLITGAGRSFSAGGDLRLMAAGLDVTAAMDYMAALRAAILAIWEAEKPVIIAVNGAAVGAGFSLALAGDLILAAEEATFAQGFANVALVPDGGSAYLLTRAVGPYRAMELVLAGRVLGAREALDLGLVCQVVPRDQLLPAAQALAQDLCGRSSWSLGLSKRMLRRCSEVSLHAAFDLEELAQSLSMQRPEHQELARQMLARKKGSP